MIENARQGDNCSKIMAITTTTCEIVRLSKALLFFLDRYLHHHGFIPFENPFDCVNLKLSNAQNEV